MDSNNDGVVDAGEQMDLSTADSSTLGPYLRAGAAPYTADNIINFIRGDHITGLRDRQLTVGGSPNVWKLGDVVNSTPTVVGPPRERYDVIYGDGSYTGFFTQYKNRRQVAYVGANDGMLHAFNVGFYHRGDDPATTTETEHGWFTRTPSDNSGGPLLGDELWGFVPYQLLPQLQWLTRADYTHVYYVDLKPKVTDARIFTPDADHPNGWGTILIGGFRMGGSCESCPAGNGPVMTVTIGGTPRKFYSAYFVLDITNPEVAPKLLWSFASSDMGLTTGYPAIVRTNPPADARTDNTNAKWFSVFGSGPTGYSASALLEGRLYAVDLKTGPGVTNSLVTNFPSNSSKSFLGDLVSLDANLDYRADVVYAGSIIDNAPQAPQWVGTMWRLTTNSGDPSPSNWGKSQKPTELLATFTCSPKPCAGLTKVGPIAVAPTVTRDDNGKFWLFFGTGRYYAAVDKTNTEQQYFFGVKDPVMDGTCTQASQNCAMNDLVNVSAATVCQTCASGTNQVTGVSGVTTLEGTATTTLQGLVASKDGWWTTLPALGERGLVSPTLFGGIVIFTTYAPTVGNVCAGESGTSSLYALFYLTGSAYKVSVIGTDTVGGNTNVKRSTSLGGGMASQVAIHMGAEGTDSVTGITSRVKACSQMSSGALTCMQAQPALSAWSRYVSWISLRL